MDLITQLPRTAAGHDAIVVFVDKLSKMVHYCTDHDHCHCPAAGSICSSIQWCDSMVCLCPSSV